MAISKNTIILIVLGLLILAAAWYITFGAPDGASVLSADSAPASEAELTFLSLTARIDPVKLDASIIDDPRFSLLRDLRTSIVPEVSGRSDPFAPL